MSDMKDRTFSMKVGETSQEEKPFTRDDSDNKYFPEIQVKDIRSIITEDCYGALDADTTVWKACANQEIKSIKATCSSVSKPVQPFRYTLISSSTSKVFISTFLRLC